MENTKDFHKVCDPKHRFRFNNIAVESLGPMHESVQQFLVELGRKIAGRSADDREGSFLFQHTSIL